MLFLGISNDRTMQFRKLSIPVTIEKCTTELDIFHIKLTHEKVLSHLLDRTYFRKCGCLPVKHHLVLQFSRSNDNIPRKCIFPAGQFESFEDKLPAYFIQQNPLAGNENFIKLFRDLSRKDWVLHL